MTIVYFTRTVARGTSVLGCVVKNWQFSNNENYSSESSFDTRAMRIDSEQSSFWREELKIFWDMETIGLLKEIIM